MEENIALAFHGFLNLNGKEKLRLVEEINGYFDSTEREPIREENERKVREIRENQSNKKCLCCGK